MGVEGRTEQKKPGEMDGDKQVVFCADCGTENKIKAKRCKKCSYDLSLPPLWIPTWKWHLKVLAVIYVILTAAYFAIDVAFKQLAPPLNIRQLPPEVTPWLKK